MNRGADLLYFGKATASISHELKNVVAIINEAAGLLGDLTAAAQRGRPLEPERVLRISEEIGRNVKRAVETINRLNRFAHTVDEVERAVDVGQLLADTLAVAGRYPGLRDLTLEQAASMSAATLRTDPFRLHRALVLALKVAAAADGPSTVRVEIVAAREEVHVRVARGPLRECEEAAQELRELEEELRALGGEARLEAEAVVLSLRAQAS